MNFRCLLYAIIYCICTLCIISNILAQSPGETSPRIIIEIGKNVNITCRMNLKMFDGKNSSSLYFTTDDPNQEAVHTNIAIINETTIVYMLRNAAEQFTSYTCKSGQHAIASTDVIVGTKPTEVKDFGCQAYDFTYMTCTFTIPQNMVPTTYNLKYITQNANYILNCVKLVKEGDRGSCNFTLDDGSYKPNFEFYKFRLTSNNTLGVITQNFTINHKEIVKPAIINFRVADISTNSCALKWEMERYSSYKLNRLQMEVHLQSPHFVRTKTYTCMRCNNHEAFNLAIDELPYPYYVYNISLRIKMRMPAATWSDAYSIVFRTLPIAPEVPPTVDVSSFYLNATHLRLFWYPIAEYHRNGSNFHYIVKLSKEQGVAVNQPALHTAVPTAALLWNSAHSYDFSIWSSNDLGVSLRSSRIYVPALPKNYDNRTPLGIRNVYHSLNSTYTLFWNAPEDVRGIENYTVFWCQPKSVVSNECHNIIGFTQLDKSARNFTIQQSQQLVLAVAANYADYYTGMHWAKCTADVLNDLEKLEPKMVGRNATTITVRWSFVNVCASLIKGYTITYCQTKSAKELKCLGKNTHINVDKSDNKYDITQLQPNTSYKMEMYMYSDLQEGPISDELVLQTEEGAPTPPINLTFAHITSQSVALTWQSPEKANGQIRYYIVTYNGEAHKVWCNKLGGPHCFGHNKRGGRYGIEHLTYTLQNLSSFTNYTICIKAYTVAASPPSNCVNITTLVGVPTSPTELKVVDTKKEVLLRWRQPEVPSGRVDYYEVIVETKLNEDTEVRYISRISSGMRCTISKPNCNNDNFKYTISIRSVNIAYANETDTKLVQFDKKPTNYDHYVTADNYELACAEATSVPTSGEHTEYRSVEVNAYNSICIAMVKADSKLWIIIFCIITGTSFIFICGLLIYRRCHAMAAIHCKIPEPLVDMVNRAEDKQREYEKSIQEHNYNSENRRLLTSISNDSNSAYNGRRASDTTKTSYCDSNTTDYYISNVSDYCIQDPLTMTNTQLLTTVPESGYITMSTPLNVASAQTAQTRVTNMLLNNSEMVNGYVQPNALPTTNGSEKPFMISFAADDGYIHPNNRQSFNGVNVNNANYVTAMR